MVDLVTFGESMLRFSPPGDQRIEIADEHLVHVAGAESNVAVAAQRLGLDALWTSKLPNSSVARKVTGTLRNHGVTVEVARSDNGRLGIYYFESGEGPRGSTVVYDRADSAVTTTTPEELPLDAIRSASAFHTTGITPGLSATLESTTAELLSLAADSGTTTSFDVNYRSKLWSPTAARDVLTGLFDDVDLLTVAERDARTVLELDGSPTDIARTLAERHGFEVTILTRGDAGALALANGDVHEQPAFEASDAYPVGTGDAFVGGFLSQYVSGASVPDALEYGAATAALKRSIPGDIAVVTPGEVATVIEGGTDAIAR